MEDMTPESGKTAASVDLKKLFAAIMASFLILAVLFYYLAGDQLLYRQSRGTVTMCEGESAAAELTEGTVVEQRFTVRIMRLYSVSIQWGAFYRVNEGVVTAELLNAATGETILSDSFDAGAIREREITTLALDTPREDLYEAPLVLRLWADSPPDRCAAPLMCRDEQRENWTLTVNGQPLSGTLAMAVDGEDNIWTGLHYWKFVLAGAAALGALFAVVAVRLKRGGHSYLVNAVLAVKKYRFLIRQLVSRDFKTKYKRSVLGMLWSFLNPLLMMTVQYFVFSTLFRNDIPNYPAYLLIGIVSFNFFSEACSLSLTSVLQNANLLTKVYMPKYIYPLTRVISSLVNFAISLLPLVIVCALTGVRFHRSALLAFFFWGCLLIFALGLGLLLSASMVFFRDTQFLWGILSMIWMYATPLFYPETILPESVLGLLNFNPLYHFIGNARTCILSGVSPEPVFYFRALLMALAMLAVGSLVFKKVQDKFVLYL